MCRLAKVPDDKIATAVGYAMNHLLIVDDDSRAGVPWSVDLLPASSDGKPSYDIAVSENGKEVLVSLPPVTTISFMAVVPEVSVSQPWTDIPQASEGPTLSADQDSFWWMQPTEDLLAESPPLSLHEPHSFGIS